MTARTLLFNDGWQFTLTENDEITDLAALDGCVWSSVEIPHDWLIGDTHNLYRSGDGWYRKRFTLTERELSGRVFINFDGVYMDSTVYINGKAAGGNTYGYSAFELDITALLCEGENEILVKVCHRSPNSRWYSGAGIFRDVCLKIKPSVFLASNGIYIHSEKKDGGFLTEVETTVSDGGSGISADIRLTLEVISPDARVIAGFEQNAVFGGGDEVFLNTFTTEDPALWDINSPNVYTMRVSLYRGEELLDAAEESFGYKTAEFLPDKGFVLNGRQVKLHGVCLHHDLGALGSAFNLTALSRQLCLMKQMGANAVRTTHNMPAKQFMDICDRLGLLVDSEAFDMWENPKTEFDNARFFNETAEKDVRSWIERDRNHPSLLMWSIGNEISDTNSERGIEITKRLYGYVSKYDPKRNAPATIGSNFMNSENAQRCTDILKIAGYNYTEALYDEHHERYPDWTIYGSETASAVRSRGIYRFPASLPLLTCEDMQCSSLDNSYVGWGCSARKAWRQDRDRSFCAGQFVWTGIDYIGEPTPYSTKNSYFGIVDTAGFPKDIYYFYQSVWLSREEKPVVHIVPSIWDFNPKQRIDVIIYSNAASVGLFLNGKKIGSAQMNLSDSEDMRAVFSVEYEAGELCAEGYDESGAVIAKHRLVTPGDPVSVCLTPDRKEIYCDGRDISFVEITVLDASGNPVGNARNRVKVEVSGAGRLVGLDNGDSTDYDSYKGDNRRLFSGKLLAMVEAGLDEGEIRVRASSEGLSEAEVVIRAGSFGKRLDNRGISVVKVNAYPAVTTEYVPEIPVRKIELIGGGILDKEHPSAQIEARLYPQNATYRDISWKAIRENGTEADIAEFSPTADGAVVTAFADGSFIARAFVNNGGSIPQVYADLPFTVTGLGARTKDAYSFISAGRLDSSNVTVTIIEEGAISGFEGTTVMTYDCVDFGRTGSETLVLNIGTCADANVQVWDGVPENGELLIDARFENNDHWCGFAPQYFALSRRVSGVRTISVVIDSRIIFGGFSFLPINRAFDENFSAENDGVYGDDYKISERSVVGIGNNVIIAFDGLDFGEEGASHIVIKGVTQNPTNAVQLRFTPEGGEQKSLLLDFKGTPDISEQRFDIPALYGKNDIGFVFLPGSKFDFISFKFEK